ncbi:type IV toxin-antitoxin system AbiEi family antitoxin [Rathayibacter toxicus]|uniref:AbiEi antitoxin C-terminal domain-containing protein n=1 Tax=Rathayibacter toxicus TaxID=145458 RepID=A0A2S5Y5P6_9MICO|nr:type IV toxin-antitoxin system AbiEi family antitoxin [Rathayibacter toxicus]ALS58026.1 hypothetical protein APU90_09835 [Rathayibacter toxicus]PPG20288.1 hypothetical protein C5D15_07075 [Rathayibacter toxicus]PPG45388.1 hypothetical protein C5D16_07035 [Rathayibacter toxicus]PPH22490.1 hypothetical protein C5D17_07080 [Rathayibacter toxicus]PPH57132.1 hypothetical protein C5D30_07060 [Rathayibacter toxicus]
MARLPSVLLPGEFSVAELCAARLDGQVVPLDEGFLISDLPLGPTERAASLVALLPSGTVADRTSAAWVHGALEFPPRIHSASIDRRRRLHPPQLVRVRFHEVRLTDADITVLGNCAVTTPERTLIDLARTAGDNALLRMLAMTTTTSLDRVLDHLINGARIGGRRQVEARLRAALDVP